MNIEATNKMQDKWVEIKVSAVDMYIRCDVNSVSDAECFLQQIEDVKFELERFIKSKQ